MIIRVKYKKASTQGDGNERIAKNLLIGAVNIEIDLVAGEIGHIKAVFVAMVILPGITLREQERFGGASFIIDGGEIEQPVKSIFPA